MAKANDPPSPTPTPPTLAPATPPKHPTAPPPPPDFTTPWEAEAAAYLESRGWKRFGVNHLGQGIWYDPSVHKNQQAKLEVAKTLPAAGGGQEVLMQWRTPPCPWRYTTAEAVAIQKDHDATAQGVQSQIERKRREIEALEELATAPAKGQPGGRKAS